MLMDGVRLFLLVAWLRDTGLLDLISPVTRGVKLYVADMLSSSVALAAAAIPGISWGRGLKLLGLASSAGRS